MLEAVRTDRIAPPCRRGHERQCYANDACSGRPFVEKDPLGGDDPYSASKCAAEIVAASYRTSFFPPAELASHGVGVATARAGNVIGGGDCAPHRLIADVARAVLAGPVVELRHPRASGRGSTCWSR